MIKFYVYYAFGEGYSYSNMINYFKMNNYCKIYGKTFIVMRAIMSDSRELQGILPLKYFVVQLIKIEATSVSC